MPPNKFGYTVRRNRLALGLSTRQLARMSGVSSSYVNKIELGDVSPPGYEVCVRLSSALGLDISELESVNGRIPKDVAEKILARSSVMFEIVRRLDKKDDDYVFNLCRMIGE